MSHNGWKNYATWRVSLDFFEYSDHWKGHISNNESVSDLAACLREEVEECLSATGSGTTLDYALAFLDECSYYEIADNLIDDYKQQIKDELNNE